jgi:hypothetical protein
LFASFGKNDTGIGEITKEGACKVTDGQIKEVFAEYGYERWWKEIRYPLLSSRLLEEADEDVLAAFFESYAFPAGEAYSFTEFVVHFSVFQRLYDRGISAAWR